MLNMLPDAVMREREAMLSAALATLRAEGYEDLRARDLAGYPEPPAVTVRVINAPVQPDVVGTAPNGGGIAAGFVEPSSALSGDTAGRRWQYLWFWTQGRDGRMFVFVHPEDQEKARMIARHWHIAPQCIRVLQRD